MKHKNELEEILKPLWNEFLKEENWEVVIDGFDNVYFSTAKEGMVKKDIFKTAKELDEFIHRLLAYKGLSVNELSYFFHLDKHIRVNIVLPPKAINTPSIVMTKLPETNVTLDKYLKWGVIDEKSKKLIKEILQSDKGILLAGNVGSGKTTLLNTIINSIPHPRRIVTLERVPDLVIERPLLTRLQTQSQKASEVVELIHVAEKMRADYLVLLECVGPEIAPFIEMVRNNTTGIALITGENAVDALKRIVTKTVLSSDGFSIEEANYAVSQVFPYFIFQEKNKKGERFISMIGELKFVDGEIKIETLYKKINKV